MQLYRMILFAATLFIAGALSAAVVSEKKIPVKNPDFSQTKNNVPIGWWINPSLSVSIGKDGKTSFITLKAKKDSGWLSIAQIVLSSKDLPVLKAGESYRFILSYRQKSNDVQKHAFGNIGVYGAGKRLIARDGTNSNEETGEWKNAVVTLELAMLPAGAEDIRICFFLDGAGSVSFTDAQFVVQVVDNQ